MPVVELEVRLPAVVGQLVVAGKAQADAAGPGVVVVEAYARHLIAAVVQRGALPDHLHLRFQPPRRLTEVQQRFARLHRHAGAITLDPEAEPARGTYAAVVAALHRHGVDVAVTAAGEGPVQAHVLVVQAVLAYLHVLPAQCQAGGLALRAGAADEHADLVAVVVRSSSPHVEAGLQAQHIAIEAGLRIALPMNLAALPHQTAPCGAERTLVVQQALLALPLVERAEAGQRGLAQQRRHHGVGGGLHAVQRHHRALGGACTRRRRRTGSGQRTAGHRHVRHRWITGRRHRRRFRWRRRWCGLAGCQVWIGGAFGPRRRCRGDRWRWCDGRRRRRRHAIDTASVWRWCRAGHQGRAQVPVLAGTGTDTTLEQEVLVGAGRDRREQRKRARRGAATIQGLHHQDAIGQRGSAAAAGIEHADAGGAGGGTAIDHQAVAGGIVRPQNGAQVQATTVTAVVATHGEHVAGASTGQVDAPGIDHLHQCTTVERTDGMAATARVDGAGVIHRERAGAGSAVAQHQIAIKGQLGAVGQADRLPVLEAAHARGLDVVEVELVDATAAVQQRHRTEVALVEAAEVGHIVVRPHVDRAVDDATATPVEGVAAGTEQHLPAHGAVGDGHAVVAATDTDVAADVGRARDDDGIGVEAGHHVAVHRTARLVPQVLVQLHVDAADAASGHPGLVAILERADDAATAHAEGIDVVALLQRAYRAATHDEIIAATALRHHAGDGAAGDGHLVIAAALVDAVDRAIAEQQHIVSIALQDAAADAAALHLEAIIARIELYAGAPADRSSIDQHAVARTDELQGGVVAGADAAGVVDAAATPKLHGYTADRTDRALV